MLVLLLLSLIETTKIMNNPASIILRDNPAYTIEVETFAACYRTYLKKFGKSYGAEETLRRFQVFKASMKEIDRLNERGGANYGWTKFTDVAPEEMFSSYSEPFPEISNFQRKLCNFSDDFYHLAIPNSVDWREEGKVGPVLDQKMCNGCWAFSIIGAMESMAAIQDPENGIVRLSIQELLDCPDKPPRPPGCEKGNVNQYLNSMYRDHMNVLTENEYPLTLVSEKCQRNGTGRQIACYNYFPGHDPASKEDEMFLLRLVAHHGPVIVVVNAGTWRFYLDGVISESCYRSKSDSKEDHVVQIVGYNLTPPPPELPYYIVRNSWGENFGINGYVKLAVFKNICGVSDEIHCLRVKKK